MVCWMRHRLGRTTGDKQSQHNMGRHEPLTRRRACQYANRALRPRRVDAVQQQAYSESWSLFMANVARAEPGEPGFPTGHTRTPPHPVETVDTPMPKRCASTYA